jgi:hypothetical protein
LKAAQAQIEKLQAELDNAKRGTETSFVGNANAWGRSAAPAANAAQERLAPLTQSSGRSSAPAPAAAAAAAPSAWGSGMMANLATTAAGVVAGSFLYQGIQNMMGHHSTGPGSDLGTSSSAAASDPSNAPLSTDEVAQTLDEHGDDDDSDTSLASSDDGGFDSDLG